MKINFLVSPKSGISYHRLINPMSFYPLGEDVKAEMLWVKKEEHFIDCDILYYNKFIYTDLAILKKMKSSGMKIVLDIDDYWHLPSWHISKKNWELSKLSKFIEENIKLADVVICASMRLQGKVREFNKNTVVIPNAFPYGFENYSPNPIKRDKMGFIYAGGSTHLKDVELLQGKFMRIGSDDFIKQNAEFILAGYEPTMFRKYETKEDLDKLNDKYVDKQIIGEWDRMSTIFRGTGSYKILPTADLDNYINYYDQADIVLIPLRKDNWNSYKSTLKIMEAACKELPVICSAVEPYYPEFMDYPGIYWVHKPGDWLDHIKYCIKNREKVAQEGKLLAERIKEEYSLLKWNITRKEIFESL